MTRAASSTFDQFMTEHAAWHRTAEGYSRVFALPCGTRHELRVDKKPRKPDQLLCEGPIPHIDSFRLAHGAGKDVPELARALEQLGTVGRIRNSNLWDAIGTAIIRQVIRAGHAKRMYRRFCETHGEAVRLRTGAKLPLFPSAETVMALHDDEFAALGMAFKRRPLRAAAQAYMASGDSWRQLSPSDLVVALTSVPHVGQWTARAAVTDWSNDWSIYPYADLAVRTWAKRAAPSYPWPSEERSFGEVWLGLTGEHLSTITLLTLAWGSYHGDSAI